MSAELHDIRAAVIERERGQEFTARIQSAMDSLEHWRRLLVLELGAAGDDKVELDTLHFELIECGYLIHDLAMAGERMTKVREGEPWARSTN